MTDIYWLEQRSCDVPVGDEWLARSEVARLATLRFARRREDWRLGRWTAKRGLSVYLGLSGCPAELAGIAIRASPEGVPEAFIDGRRAAASISISHRAGIGFCAIAPYGTMLGCDVETVEPRSTGFVEDYFTGEEQKLIHLAADAGRDSLITLLWSAKESVLKALGVGLRRATTDVRVHPAGSGGAGVWEPLCGHTIEGGIFHGWHREAASLLRTIAVAAPNGGCLVQA